MTDLTLQGSTGHSETTALPDFIHTSGDSGAAPTIKTTSDIAADDVTSLRSRSRAYLAGALDNAELLLAYATEIGINVDEGIRNAIFNASVTSADHWSEQTASNLLTALTQLGE